MSSRGVSLPIKRGKQTSKVLVTGIAECRLRKGWGYAYKLHVSAECQYLLRGSPVWMFEEELVNSDAMFAMLTAYLAMSDDALARDMLRPAAGAATRPTKKLVSIVQLLSKCATANLQEHQEPTLAVDNADGAVMANGETREARKWQDGSKCS